MSDTKKRLLQFLQFKQIGQQKFEFSIGMSNGWVNKIGDSIRENSINKIREVYPELNIAWLKSGVGNMLLFGSTDAEMENEDNNDQDTAAMVSLLPIAAQGGSLGEFSTAIMKSECERIISPIKGADLAITVFGDSMAPEYPNGSKIFIKKINERAFIEWGKAYVLDTCNGTVVKTLVPSDKEGYVRCISINPDPIFAPFDVAWVDIQGVYRVLLCMAVK